MEDEFGKAASTLRHLIKRYKEHTKISPLPFLLSIIFPKVPLPLKLCKRNYDTSGTIRSNRLDERCPLPDVARIDKKERGSSSPTPRNLSTN